MDALVTRDRCSMINWPCPTPYRTGEQPRSPWPTGHTVYVIELAKTIIWRTFTIRDYTHNTLSWPAWSCALCIMANRPVIDTIPYACLAALWRNRINFLQLLFPTLMCVCGANKILIDALSERARPTCNNALILKSLKLFFIYIYPQHFFCL